MFYSSSSLLGLLHCFIQLVKLSEELGQRSSDPRNPMMPHIPMIGNIVVESLSYVDHNAVGLSLELLQTLLGLYLVTNSIRVQTPRYLHWNSRLRKCPSNLGWRSRCNDENQSIPTTLPEDALLATYESESHGSSHSLFIEHCKALPCSILRKFHDNTSWRFVTSHLLVQTDDSLCTHRK